MRDIKRILCPVDLSDVSRHAVQHALVLARWYKARITALHVCNPIEYPVPGFGMGAADSPLALTPEEIGAITPEVLAQFGDAGDVPVDVFVETGQASHRIVDAATSLPADLIVMGTHGSGGFQHLVLGSVAEKVLRLTRCPVLTVPPRARTTSKLPFKRVLCPVDFSDSSLAALEIAESLALEGDAEMTILHVLESFDEPLTDRPITVPEYQRQRECDAVAKLNGLVPESMKNYCRPMTRVMHGKAYREILGAAAEDESDVIVMGVHGRNALDLMLFGSTTNQVVRRATCPVLTLRQ